MNTKRTMTLNLTHQEMRVLEELSNQKDLSKTAILRQALRLYQLVEVKLSEGGSSSSRTRRRRKRS